MVLLCRSFVANKHGYLNLNRGIDRKSCKDSLLPGTFGTTNSTNDEDEIKWKLSSVIVVKRNPFEAIVASYLNRKRMMHVEQHSSHRSSHHQQQHRSHLMSTSTTSTTVTHNSTTDSTMDSTVDSAFLSEIDFDSQEWEQFAITQSQLLAGQWIQGFNDLVKYTYPDNILIVDYSQLQSTHALQSVLYRVIPSVSTVEQTKPDHTTDHITDHTYYIA